MSRRSCRFLLQLLFLAVLADALGVLGSFTAAADPHIRVSVHDVGASGVDGSADPATRCTHACHAVYHLLAPVSEQPVVTVPDSDAPPAYLPQPLPAVDPEAPLQPPRMLA